MTTVLDYYPIALREIAKVLNGKEVIISAEVLTLPAGGDSDGVQPQLLISANQPTMPIQIPLRKAFAPAGEEFPLRHRR